ncbi:hypothetical protein ACIQGT_25845 [Streptomyces sp. NPDC093108]|uniref:hypothetical protein n=1 Tax=Streptomyces sp. NPDC093108 TaxID=3366030 RepID=UPI0037F88C32
MGPLPIREEDPGTEPADFDPILTLDASLADETADALFHALLDTVRETASGNDPADNNLMRQLPDMAPRDALTVLKKAGLPSDLIEPIADALAVLAPHAYAPRQTEPRPVPQPGAMCQPGPGRARAVRPVSTTQPA